jgi:uncharacterized protein
MVRKVVLLAMALIGASLASGPAHSAVITMCNVPIQMSDGALMRANITRPDAEPHPTIVTVTGYNKDLGAPTGACAAGDSSLTGAGYNVMVIDDRGTGSSDGRWDIWGVRTQQDYVEEADWLMKQSWHSGPIGTTGGSYLGITSLLFAEANPTRVGAIFADVPMSDAYRDVTYFGGNLDTDFMPVWFGFTQATNTNTPTQLFQGDPPVAVAENAFDHVTGGPATVGQQLVTGGLKGGNDSGIFSPYDQASSRLRSPAERAYLIKGAVFWTGGWFDIFQRGEPYLFYALRNTPPGGKKWVQSPTYHTAGTDHWDEMGIGSKSKVKVQWFDHWLKGVDNGIQNLDPMHLWDVNANKWETGSEWPLKQTRWTKMFLSPDKSGSTTSLNDGSLVASPPTSPSRDLLPFIPVGGLCNRSTIQWAAGAGAGIPCETDQRLSEPGTFTYTTAALKDPLHIAGPIAFQLWAELDRFDASFYVALTDVAPDGTSTQISSGGLDASHAALDRHRTWRNSDGDVILPYHLFTYEAQRDVVVEDPHAYEIEIYPTNWTLLPGHRLRLVLGTADTPHFQVPADRLAKMLGGTIRVLAGGPYYQSRLLLPVQP